ncbi:MAG: 1-deoxy-D-xylulose 5-phosphate synthase, partial [uncultured Thermomicrobiales bacterium]
GRDFGPRGPLRRDRDGRGKHRAGWLWLGGRGTAGRAGPDGPGPLPRRARSRIRASVAVSPARTGRHLAGRDRRRGGRVGPQATRRDHHAGPSVLPKYGPAGERL